MALTNCTITESSLTKVGGAQIGSDNIQLVITPNAGYVVSAAAFTNNTGTLSGISSISFSNSGTANTIGNTVLVAVDLTDTFVMPSANTTLTIDVDGAAILRSYALAGTVKTEEANTTTSSGTTSYSATGNFNQQVTVLTKTFTAASGYYFPDDKTKLGGGLINIISDDNFQRTNITNSNTLDSSGRIVSCTFTVKYTFPNEDISGQEILFIAKAEQFFVPVVEITSYNIIKTNIDPVGVTRSMSVYGTPTATFSLAVTNEDSTSIHSISNLTIGATGKQQFDITFPTVTDSDHYDFILTGSNVSTNFGGSGEQDHSFRIRQDLPITLQVGLHYAANAPSGVSITANKSITLQPNTDSFLNSDVAGEDGDLTNTFTITRAAGLQIDTAAGNMSQFTNLTSNGGTIFGGNATTEGLFESLAFTATNSTTVSAVFKGGVIFTGGNDVTSLFNLENYISAGNSAPVANTVSVSATKGGGVLVTLNATDADSDSLTYTIVSVPTNASLFTDAGQGTAVSAGTVLSAATVYYKHNNSNNFTDSFTYKANDGTIDSNTATVNAAIGVSPGASISTSGAAGVYLVPIVLGTGAGTFKAHCNAQTVPDRFEILFSNTDNANGNTLANMSVQADSLYVGDGISSTAPPRQQHGPSGMSLFTYNGSSFDTTSTNSQTVTITNDHVASNATGNRSDASPNGASFGSGSQSGVQNLVFMSVSDTTGTKDLAHSDGNICLTFTKGATTNTYLAYLRVTGIGSTQWDLFKTEFA